MVRTKLSGDNAVVSNVVVFWMIFEHLQWKSGDGENHFGKMFVESNRFEAIHRKSILGRLIVLGSTLEVFGSCTVESEHTGVEMKLDSLFRSRLSIG